MGKRVFFKKLTPVILILAIVCYGLYFYNENQDFFKAYKGYYLQSYVAAYEYTIKSYFSDLFGNVSTTSADSNNQEYATSIPVIMYHGIISRYPDGSNVSLKQFINQMETMKANGYETVSIEDYYNFIFNGKKLPAKSFLLTFDDGRKDAYYPVEPILNALNYRATMFVITGQSFAKNSKFYLNQRELLKMKNSGHWDLQVHTKNGHSLYYIDATTKGHYYNNKLWLPKEHRLETDQEFKTRVTNDLVGAKDDMKQYLGIDSISMAIPFGDTGEDITNYPGAYSVFLTALQATYPMAFYQFYNGRGYSFNAIDSKLFLNNRISILPMWQSSDLMAALKLGESKPLPYTDNFTTNNGWLSSWGDAYLNGKGLLLKSSLKISSADTYLDGTYNWTNYTATVNAHLDNGDVLKILGRKVDSNNYVDCSYKLNDVSIENIVNGNKTIIDEEAHPVNLLNGFTNIGISMNGKNVECLINGQVAASTNKNNLTLINGGPSLEVWSPLVNNAQAEFQNFVAKSN